MFSPTSLKFKLVLGFLGTILISTVAITSVIHSAYKQNLLALMHEELDNTRDSFNAMIEHDTRTLSAVMTTLLANKEILSLFAQKDRDRLLQMTLPVYKTLEERFNITHWYFLNPETGNPDTARKCFLRVHAPALFGDTIPRATYENAVKTKTFASGLELGKTAFALRVVHPMYDNNGSLLGYMELGEEIDQFFSIMKKQTGNEYGLLAKKQYLDAESWASVRRNKNLPNNWDERASVMLIYKTTDKDTIIKYSGDIEKVSDRGVLLNEERSGDTIYSRALFPVYDARKQKVGGVFVLRDVTALSNRMHTTQRMTTIIIVGVMIFISLFVLFLIDRLVFCRLNAIIRVATRVVGGDYHAKITPSANDEIGKFESLFEQFRALFVDILQTLEKKEKADKR